MGTEIKPVDGEVNKDAGRKRTSGTGERISSGSTRPTSTTAGAGTGTGTGTGTTAGTGTEEKQAAVSGLATISDEEQKRLERNRKRRERYAKEKEANGGQVKPRKVNKTKQKDAPLDTSQLDTLILSLFTIVASRPGCEHWALSQKEVESITKPLSAMIAESEALNVINQNSNQIALVIACVTIFAPRIIITVQKQTKKKEVEKIVKTGQTKGNVTPAGGKADSGNTGRHATHGTDTRSDEYYFGSPIS